MPRITIELDISAPIEICFDLARSIDLHQISTQDTEEKAIAGVTSGLINLNETVTWRAKHFGLWLTLTSKITGFDYPHFFKDEMIKGNFKSFDHEHHFKPLQNGTRMIDCFNYKSPFGIIGKMADKVFLQRYMYNFLYRRNMIIKQYAESDLWKLVLKS